MYMAPHHILTKFVIEEQSNTSFLLVSVGGYNFEYFEVCACIFR